LVAEEDVTRVTLITLRLANAMVDGTSTGGSLARGGAQFDNFITDGACIALRPAVRIVLARFVPGWGQKLALLANLRAIGRSGWI
jgi:hypothetical protein